MKINSITTLNKLHSRGNIHSTAERREHATVNKDLKNLNNQINTTIKRDNSDGRVSFKGAEIVAPTLHKIAKYTRNNPLIAEAIFALFITCGLRPLTIMATAKTEEDKAKCEYQAVKSISSGLVGLAMTALVGTPIGKATKVVKEANVLKIPPEIAEKLDTVIKKGADSLQEAADNLKVDKIALADNFTALLDEGIFDIKKLKKLGNKGLKEQKALIKQNVSADKYDDIIKGINAQFRKANYESSAKNVIDKLFQPAFMPLRAAVTIALVPIILKALGKQKPSKPQPNVETTPQVENKNPQVTTENVQTTPVSKTQSNGVFNDFASKKETQAPSFKGNVNNSTPLNPSNPSFKGATDFVLKPLTEFYKKVADAGLFQNLSTKISSSNRTFTHLMVLDSVILSTFYTVNSLRNKKIDKEQKPQMVINDALTLGVSAAGSYLLDEKVSKVVSKFGESYIEKNGDFYKQIGQIAIDKMGDEAPMKQLLSKIDEVVKLPKEDFKKGLENIGEMITEHIKPIVSDDENTEKALTTTKKFVDEMIDDVKIAVKNASKDGKTDDLLKKVTERVGETYKTVSARASADKFLTGLNKLKVLVVFGLIYRYLGPVFVTPVANKLSDKFFGKDKKKDKAEQQPATQTVETVKVQQQPTQVVPAKLVSKPENLLEKHLAPKSTTA